MKASIIQLLKERLSFIPTKDQKVAMSKIADFLLSADTEAGFILKGYAGTGKTSLVGALVKLLKDIERGVVLLAPTGRAAKVMSRYSGFPAYTIHKQIYYQGAEREGALFFTKGKNNFSNTVFIIDEASMIGGDFQEGNANLLDDLIAYVYSGRNCKILFVGDTAQLPPVGTEKSLALDKEQLERTYPLNFTEVELKEVVRQELDSGILWNATQIRNQIIQNDGGMVLPELSDEFEDTMRITGYELQDELETCINLYGVENVVLITRSNKRANIFNQETRARVFWYEEQIVPHDLLMVVKNNYYWLDKKSKAAFIANGDTLEIMEIVKYEELYGFHFADVVVRFVDNSEEPEFLCKIMLDTLSVESPALPRPKLVELFYEIEKDFYHIRDKRKRQQLVMKTPHFNALQVKFSYALTCHKAQGGQWNAVFIDQGYITKEMINTEYLRWLYTAVTRATDRVYFLNFNALFFGEDDEYF